MYFASRIRPLFLNFILRLFTFARLAHGWTAPFISLPAFASSLANFRGGIIILLQKIVIMLSLRRMVLFCGVKADETAVFQTMIVFNGLAAQRKVLHIRMKPPLVVLVSLWIETLWLRALEAHQLPRVLDVNVDTLKSCRCIRLLSQRIVGVALLVLILRWPFLKMFHKFFLILK